MPAQRVGSGQGRPESRPGKIERAVERATAQDHDLIVVGGGIYGVALALEAARRGLRPLLVERDDFGGATSWANLRILHGGLRYLQKLDLVRFYESVGERSWFLRHFPDLVRPLPCLMPLYGRGLKRPSVFRAALALNDLLAWRRNAGVADAVRLPHGRLASEAETTALFPAVERRGLQGGALWYDAVMLSPERLAIEMLRWACACGASALNYVEARELLLDRGGVLGILAHDRIAGRELRLRAATVINAAGPWSRDLARRLHSDLPALFRPALAFNLLLNRPPLAEVAVAVEPGRPAAPVYFCLPWKGLLLAGTSYAAVTEDSLEAAPSEAQVAAFLADLRAAVPGLDAAPDDVLQVYAGLLPADAAGTTDLANRPLIHDHGAAGGPKGLFSVSGVKFTTARRVAEKTLARAFGRSLPPMRPEARRPAPVRGLCGNSLMDGASPLDGPLEPTRARLRALAEQESVLCLEDLLLRRMDSSLAARDAGARARLCELLGWAEESPSPAGGAVQRVGTGVSPR
ncbi:MAG TPA: FAD-dependent oxidoreductase [Geminicoccaceae bacterium]|nr:FAD-dependent oxidoreductase [Geminicoccaceae bacterium]